MSPSLATASSLPIDTKRRSSGQWKQCTASCGQGNRDEALVVAGYDGAPLTELAEAITINVAHAGWVGKRQNRIRCEIVTVRMD